MEKSKVKVIIELLTFYSHTFISFVFVDTLPRMLREISLLINRKKKKFMHVKRVGGW